MLLLPHRTGCGACRWRCPRPTRACPLALGATARRSVPPVPSMISPGGVAMAAWSLAGGRVLAVGGGAGEDGQDGQPLAGPLVHPGLAAPAFLGPADLGVADRARDCPLRPAFRFLHGPLGDVEVERPDAHQLVLGVDPRPGDDGLLPVGAGDAALDGLQVFLPGACDLRRQPQRADARGQGLDPGPEQAGQGPWRSRPGWRSRVRAAVPSGSPRAGRGPACTAAGSGRRVPRRSAVPGPCRTRGSWPGRRRGRSRGRAGGGRSRLSSGRRGRGPAAGYRPSPRSPRR